MKPSVALVRHRVALLELIARFPVGNPRVLGSVLRETDHENSDLDLLVDLHAGTTLFDLGELQVMAEDLLGVRVDIKTPNELPSSIRERVIEEAKAI